MWRNKSMINAAVINAAIKRGFCSKAPQRNKSKSLTKHLKLSYYSITPLIAYSGDRILNPIVMYHGLMATKDIWQPTIDPLLRHTNRAVFVVDARNHGESPFHKFHSLNALTSDLNSFLEEMRIDKAVLIGQGCGAKSVLQLATLRPDKVEKLIALDLNSTSIPGIHTNVMKKVNDALIQATLKVEEDETLEAARARLFLKLAHILDDELLIRFLVSKLVMNEDQELRIKYNIFALNKFLKDKSSRNIFRFKFPFKGKTLIMHRRPFRAVRQEYSVLRKNLPNSRYAFIKAQHFMQTEAPKRFAKSVANFINETS